MGLTKRAPPTSGQQNNIKQCITPSCVTEDGREVAYSRMGCFHVIVLFFHVDVVNSLGPFDINTKISSLVILLLTVSAAIPVCVASPACL